MIGIPSWTGGVSVANGIYWANRDDSVYHIKRVRGELYPPRYVKVFFFCVNPPLCLSEYVFHSRVAEACPVRLTDYVFGME